MSPKRIGILVGCGIAGLILMISVSSLIGWNAVGKMKTVQYPTGNLGFANKQGIYFKGFGKVNDWPQVANLSIGSYEGGKDDIDAADVERIPISFRGSATAQQSLLVRIDMPTDKTQMFEILRMFPGGYENFVRKGLMPEIETATRTAANLMEAEEALNNISSFKDKIQDQLIFGPYMTESHFVIDTNNLGETERKSAVRIISEGGIAKRLPLDINKLGCKVRTVQASQPMFDESVQTAINSRRQASLAAETAKKERIAAEQQKLSAVAVGEKDVITEQYRLQKENATIVATARMKQEASVLNLQAADNDAAATLKLATAEAKAKEMIMKADGYREKILKAEITKTELIADAIKNSSGRFVPEIVIGGDASKSTSAEGVSNLIHMLNAGQATDLVDKFKK